MMTLRVPGEEAGERLDQALARLLPRYSRNRLQAWIRDGRLLRDGHPETSPRTRLRGGETLTLACVPEPGDCAHTPEAIALDVVYGDAALFVINKPAGLVTHPGSGNWCGTLLNALLHLDPALVGVPRAGIVHRLDKDTSGLIVIARTLETYTSLVRQLQARSVRREYLAVLTGVPPQPEGRVDAPIGRHPRARVRMAVVAAGKPAVTEYRILRRFAAACLAACRLQTGRTHQIRVHMAHLGHPLLGDPVYGGSRLELPPFSRQALHAARLGLTHPVSGAACAWEAPLPEDMRELLELLERNAG
ncbi:MAG: RluA family pseudouridine synthase [Zoogloeaceae bacterium]|jgi:23S rRNA pseudouridine1911/1915/1917 synthase|nr:RluA family pseudouridine synthase [Zoogloeaceae bacterium]